MFLFGRGLKNHLVPTLFYVQEHLPLDWVTERSTQPSFEYFQWGMHNFSGWLNREISVSAI